MIQIDMSMPKNCLDCPACNEYLTCAIPINGRKWGENDVRDFGQGRPEWCPMKEQEAVEPTRVNTNYEQHWNCGNCNAVICVQDKFCHECGKRIEWKGR